jgi:hypothetical protein
VEPVIFAHAAPWIITAAGRLLFQAFSRQRLIGRSRSHITTPIWLLQCTHSCNIPARRYMWLSFFVREMEPSRWMVVYASF